MVLYENVCLDKPKKETMNQNSKDYKAKSGRSKLKQVLVDTIQPGQSSGKHKHHKSREKTRQLVAEPRTDQRVSEWIDNHFTQPPSTRKHGSKSSEYADIPHQPEGQREKVTIREDVVTPLQSSPNIGNVAKKSRSRRRNSHSLCYGVEAGIKSHEMEDMFPSRIGKSEETETAKSSKKEDIKVTTPEECQIGRRSVYRRSKSLDSPRDIKLFQKQLFLKSMQKQPPSMLRSTSVGTDEQKRRKKERSYESLNSLVHNTQICYSLLHLTQMSTMTDVCSAISSPNSTLRKNKKLERSRSTAYSRSRQSSEQKSCEILEESQEIDDNQTMSPRSTVTTPRSNGDTKDNSLSTICPRDVCDIDIVVSPPPPDVCPVIEKGARKESGPDVCSMVQNHKHRAKKVQQASSDITTPDNADQPSRKGKKEKAHELKQRQLRLKKNDPRRKSDSHIGRSYRTERVEMHPDNPDSTVLAKATKVLQEHVKDVTEKTKNNCCVAKPVLKENMVIPNYNTNDPSLHYIVDKNTGVTYLRGKLLGKGGFAKCYELTDVKSNKSYAGKIISKSRLSKPHQKEKIAREIELHRNLRHRNVVGFHSYFEDESNVYIILENCSRKSLVHVLKSRKTLTEPEARFHLVNLVNGSRYIHSNRIIHRDLKLGNMLLNEKMEVKLADFGLATRVEYEGEKKMTVCGTPNYIAPEVLQKKGHSYEADIWAIGCVLYALLVGRPPFETSSLKETYMRINANKYSVPSHISKSAKHLIQKLLHPDPAQRPTLEKILKDDFFTAGYMPKHLPTSCCDSAPKWPASTHTPQRPKSYAAPVSPSEAMHKITTSLAQWKGSKKSSSQILSQQHGKEDLSTHPHAKELRDATTPTPSVISEPARKHSRDRSPYHHHHHGNQQHHHTRSRSTDGRHHSGSERSKSPPKSPRQVIIETKPSLQETNNNLINSAHLNGYHPAMVLCSAAPPPAHYSSSQKVYQSSTTALASQQTARQQSPTSVISSQQGQNAQDGKGLPVGSAIRLYQLLGTCLEQMPGDSNPTPIVEAKPLWVTKWVDYSNKYGFGFQLSDKSVGVLFNDTTRMLLAPDGKTIQYNDLSNRVYTFTVETAPAEHQKKSTLLLYFAQYMGEHLIHGGDLLHHAALVEPTAIFMKKWFRTGKAIVMYLNNGTLQVNFFDDHTKVILSPEGHDYLVTYINSSRQALSYKLSQFRHFGCKPDVAERLAYAKKMLESIINIEGETV